MSSASVLTFLPAGNCPKTQTLLQPSDFHAGSHLTQTSYSSDLRLRLILRPTVSRSVPLGVGHHDQILIFLCLTITFFVLHVGRPLVRKDGL
jgi:hypothetical protein